MTNKLQRIETDRAPRAIGPYSQAITDGDYLFISGQLPIDPNTSQMIERDILKQTKLVLENIRAILQAKGLGFDSVVRVDIFLQDFNHYKDVNSIYSQYFTTSHPPARQAIEVARLPLDSLIEISCIARC